MPGAILLRRAGLLIEPAARVGTIIASALVFGQPGVLRLWEVGAAIVAVLSALLLWQQFRIGWTILDLGWTDTSLVNGLFAAIWSVFGTFDIVLVPPRSGSSMVGFGALGIGMALSWLAMAAGARVCENGIALNGRYLRWAQILSCAPTDAGFALKVRWLVFRNSVAFACPPARRAEVAFILARHVGRATRPLESGA